MGIDEIFLGKLDKIISVASKYGVRNVRVFGSVARGEATTDSDIDLLKRLYLNEFC